MRREPQPYDQALVTKYALFITKDGICELRMEGSDRRGLLFARLDYGKLHGVIGVAGP